MPNQENCPVCGQPDNCGDCDHTDGFTPVREAYARWWFSVEAVIHGFPQVKEFESSEDLGDWAEALGTVFTFGPNPRTFPEHPWSFDPNLNICKEVTP